MVNWKPGEYETAIRAAVRSVWPGDITLRYYQDFQGYDWFFNQNLWVRVISGTYIKAEVLVSTRHGARELSDIAESVRQQMRRHIKKCPTRICEGAIIDWK